MNVLCAYRYFKHEIRHLSYLSEDLEIGVQHVQRFVSIYLMHQ